MKKIYLILVICLLSSTIFCQQFNWNKVEILYCNYLGYQLKYQEVTNKYVVVLPNLDKPEPKRNKVVTFHYGIIDNNT